jgi:type I restriction enzyme, S subunit
MSKHSKITQKRLQPRLRFPEFREAWNIPTLADISKRITEKVGTQSLATVSISAGIGFVSQSEKFSRDISGDQYKNYIVLNEGDFSYNKGNSKKFPQGCVCKLREFKKVAAPNVFFSFKFKSDYVADFYLGYFESNFHGEQLKKFITSGARSNGLLNISADAFFGVKLPTPANRKEQQKIADCLLSLDELIVAEDTKLKALQRHKKGLMQSLFPAEGETTPKLRFPEFRDAGVNRPEFTGE